MCGVYAKPKRGPKLLRSGCSWKANEPGTSRVNDRIAQLRINGRELLGILHRTPVLVAQTKSEVRLSFTRQVSSTYGMYIVTLGWMMGLPN